jgi:hypothetical protein
LLLFHQATKILLVDQAACKRFNTALQLQQGEFRRHQLEHHRAVFDLGAQPRDSRCENAAMICVIGRPGTRMARCRCREPLPGSARPRRQQLIALQDQFPHSIRGRRNRM